MTAKLELRLTDLLLVVLIALQLWTAIELTRLRTAVARLSPGVEAPQ